jgi:hypothetical protein
MEPTQPKKSSPVWGLAAIIFALFFVSITFGQAGHSRSQDGAIFGGLLLYIGSFLLFYKLCKKRIILSVLCTVLFLLLLTFVYTLLK